VCTAPGFEWEGWRWSQQRRPSLVKERRRQTMNKHKKTGKAIESSPNEVKSRESSFTGRISRVEKSCQAVRSEGQIIHYREILLANCL
jgi:hypothetical protein